MEQKLFCENIKEKAEKLKIKVNNKQAEKFYQYMQMLLEWNEKINLTAITETNEIILKHFIDSLSIYPYIEESKNVLDIGTGAGFPGIPLKILLNEKHFTLLDSLNKRVNFLNIVIDNLKLEKICAVHARAEEFINKENNREKYETVTSRAVAKLNVLVEYMLPFVQINGRCICMKSCQIDQELQEAQKAIMELGGRIEKVDDIILPESDVKRKIIVIKKVRKTPNKYPRKAGIPAKQPII